MTSVALKHKATQFSLSKWLPIAMARLQAMFERHHQRRMLANLDAHMRQDLGLSDEQIRQEVAKPFWR